MDEILLKFVMINNKYDETKEAKAVQPRSIGNENTTFTAVLTCMANGTKLKSMVIFKRNSTPKNSTQDLFDILMNMGWMDENGVKLWMKNIR